MAQISAEAVANEVGLPAEELSKPCDNLIIPLLSDCFIEWRVIFASLLSEIDIDDVTRDNPNSEKERRIAALRKWKNSTGSRATYKVLASVLLSNGRKDQAESLCRILANQLDQRITATNGKPSLASVSPAVPTSSRLLPSQRPQPTPPLSSLRCSNTAVERHSPPCSLEEEIKQLDKEYTKIERLFLSTIRLRDNFHETMLDWLRVPPVDIKSQFSECLQENEEALRNASSVDQLHKILSPYWDPLHPTLLEYLIEELADDNLNAKINGYMERLRNFRHHTKLGNFIDKWMRGSPPGFKEYIMEVGEEWRDKTLEEFNQFIVGLSRQKCIGRHIAYITKVTTCCIAVVIALPQCCFPLKPDDELLQYLRKNMVRRISAGDECILNLEANEIDNETSESSDTVYMEITEEISEEGYSSCMSTSTRSLSPAVPVGLPIASASGVLRSTLFKQAPGVGLHFNVKNIIKILAGVDYLKLPCLAVELDLTDILGEIEAAPVPDQARKHLAIKWHQRCPSGIASRGWEILASALRSPIVGENRLASDLERWYVRRDSGASTLSSSSGSEPYSPRSPVSVGSSSTEERVATKMRALTELDARDSFANLVTLVASKLSDKQSRNELDIRSFYLYLESLFPPKALPRADDVLEIFRDINAQELWDYCQYETLERIANRFLPKDKEMSSAINEHREMVNNYNATQYIADYIEEKLDTELRRLTPTFHGRRTSRKYYEMLSLKLHDVSIRMKTLKYIRELWVKIKREFHLSDCNALLDHIYDGSIVIVWLIPPSTSKALLSPRAQPSSAIDFLQRESVVRMTLNDTICLYDVQESRKLLELCNGGNFEEVTSLLKSRDKGAAVNATFEDVHAGKSALMLVCERGHISLVLTVLDSGAEINFQQKTTGQSAIFVAAKFGHSRVVRFLLAYGADPDLMDLSDVTAARAAKQEGHANLSDELQKGKSKARIRTQNPFQYISGKMEAATDFILAPGLKLVHRAAKLLVGASRSNHLDSVKYIVNNARNLDINVRETDRHAWTALMWGTNKDNLEMVELLLTNNADPNVQDKVNQWTPLMLATRQGNLKMVKLLLDHGADPNAQSSIGENSVSLAVYEHHTEIAMLLVHRGADVNVVEENGNSPLTHACVENDIELVKLFCDYHANINHQGKRGWSPLMEAARGGFSDIVEELAKREADLNMRTEAGESAIHAATAKGHVNVVRVLAYYGADLNMPNKYMLTALMVAADKGYQSIVEALLEGDVDVNYKEQAKGWPAVFFAAKNGRVSILKKLLERGAKTELETGLKLVDVANFFKRRAIVDEIKKKSQQIHPLPPRQHEKPLVEVPGMEEGAVGIELTSFTKKDTTVGEPERQERAQAEGSPDSLGDKVAEPTADTEMGQEQSEQPDKPEAGIKDVSQPIIEQVDQQDSLDLSVVTPSTTEEQEIDTEKQTKVTESVESTAATESAGELETRDAPVSKSADKTSPDYDVNEGTIDQAPVTEEAGQEQVKEPQQQEEEREQQKAVSETQPQREEETTTTTPEEVPGDSQPTQSNQNIAEIAKFYELLLQGLDQRMNVENVKRSGRRRKGVSDVERRREEIDTRY